MKIDQINPPSNRNFGLFFSGIFIATSFYFFWNKFILISLILLIAALLFGFFALVKSDLLLPLNNLWMKLGLLLGRIISPLVLGLIFFLLITPIAVATRLFGRDELRISKIPSETLWKLRSSDDLNGDYFKYQF